MIFAIAILVILAFAVICFRPFDTAESAADRDAGVEPKLIPIATAYCWNCGIVRIDGRWQPIPLTGIAHGPLERELCPCCGAQSTSSARPRYDSPSAPSEKSLVKSEPRRLQSTLP